MQAQKYLAEHTILPMPGLMALVIGVASLLIAVAMVLGLATRFAAFGAFLIGAGSVVLAYWGTFGVIDTAQFGILGEGQLLMAAVGILLMFTGAGGWSIDRSLRVARARDKAARAIR